MIPIGQFVIITTMLNNPEVRPDNLGKEQSAASHPVVLWAKAVVENTDSASQLRSAVLEMYPDLPAALESGGYGGIRKYATSHGWATIDPLLSDLALILLLARSLPQREVIGLATLIHNEASLLQSKQDKFSKRGITLDPKECSARIDFGECFADNEDWLGALSQIVWVDGAQLEAEAKESARIDSHQVLFGKQQLLREDIEKIYTQVVLTIRPNAKDIPVFREEKSQFDELILMLSENTALRYLKAIYHALPTIAITRFLEEYNSFIQSPFTNKLEALAWTYGTYLGLHPHLDYNGTMTRILIDNFLQKKNMPGIDWLACKVDQSNMTALNQGTNDFVLKKDSAHLEQFFSNYPKL